MSDSASQSRSLANRLAHIAREYVPLGFTSFGGPGVHVVILRHRFVDKLKWVDERTFIDLFALGNALPGPGSTQLALSIAVVKHGVLPGLFAFLCWSLPGAIGMAALGVGVSRIPDTLPGAVLALLTGLNAAAVGLIGLAAFQLSKAAGTDSLTVGLIWLSASFGICYHAPWMYPTLIAGGGAATALWDFRRQWILAPLRKMLGRDTVRSVEGGQPGQGGEHEELELAGVTALRPAALPGSNNAHKLKHVNKAAPTFPPPVRNLYPTPPASPALGHRRLPDVEDHQSPSASQAALSPSGDTHPPTSSTGIALTSPSLSPLNVVSIRVAISLIAGFALLLIVPLAVRGGLSNHGKTVPRWLDFFSNMMISGTIIFGGGPVVIPLLRDYVVVPGWVSSRDFLLIFAILQAFPGPNFNFSVALGILALPAYPALGAILGYVGIFSPGIILKLGLLPFYASWREKPLARSIIRGFNAAASGLVWTAVWQLFLVGYIYESAQGPAGGQTMSGPLTSDPFWAVVASGAFVGSSTMKSPPWLSIALGGVAGLAWYGVQTS